MHQCTFVNKAHTHLWRWSWPGLHWSPWRVPSWVLGPVGLTPSRVLAPVLCCCGLGKLRDSPGTLEGSTHHIPQDVGSPGVPLPHRPQEASMHTCLHPLQMDLCSRSWRWVVPEAGGKQASPPHLSRVNGWSRPLHSFQVVAWATFLILAVANFGIFIPFLPHNWKYVAYGVSFTVGAAPAVPGRLPRGPPQAGSGSGHACWFPLLLCPHCSVLGSESSPGASPCPLIPLPLFTPDSHHGHSA